MTEIRDSADRPASDHALVPSDVVVTDEDGTDAVTADGVGGGPIVVVTAIALKPAAREALAHQLGPGHVVIDIRDAGTTADIVLVPPASPQLLGRLRGMFPQARLLIAEFTDAAYGADFAGPITRSIDSGADGYFVAPTIDELADATHQVALGGSVPRALTSGFEPRAGRPHQLSAAQDQAQVVRIDLAAWSDQIGIDAHLLAALAEPMLVQLRLQGFQVELSGDDPPSAAQ